LIFLVIFFFLFWRIFLRHDTFSIIYHSATARKLRLKNRSKICKLLHIDFTHRKKNNEQSKEESKHICIRKEPRVIHFIVSLLLTIPSLHFLPPVLLWSDYSFPFAPFPSRINTNFIYL